MCRNGHMGSMWLTLLVFYRLIDVQKMVIWDPCGLLYSYLQADRCAEMVIWDPCGLLYLYLQVDICAEMIIWDPCGLTLFIFTG